MSRATFRTAIADSLTATALFQAVKQGAVRHLDGVSPVAVIASQSLTAVQDARSIVSYPGTAVVSLYVACPIGEEAATEDQLDNLTQQTMAALLADGFVLRESNAFAEGAPLREIDGTMYRVERLTVLDEDYDAS